MNKRKFHRLLIKLNTIIENILLRDVKEEEIFQKIEVTELDIVVKGTTERPYYLIRYHEIGKDFANEGYGSYYLSLVFWWKKKNFKLVKKGDIDE